jgi:hypothetical protein
MVLSDGVYFGNPAGNALLSESYLELRLTFCIGLMLCQAHYLAYSGLMF